MSTQGDRDLTFGLRPVAVGPDGRLLMATAAYMSDFEQEWLDGHLIVFDPDSRAVDTLGSFPTASRRPESGINPFLGGGVVAGTAGGFVHARMDRPELTRRSADGDTSRILRWQAELTYPDRAMFDEFVAFLREDLVRVNPRMSADRVRQFVDDQVATYALDTSVPLPLFGRIYGGADGSVWMDAFTSTPRTTRYVVISADGAQVGIADFGEPFTVLDVTADRVLGVISDEFDVQAVALYRYSLDR